MNNFARLKTVAAVAALAAAVTALSTTAASANPFLALFGPQPPRAAVTAPAYANPNEDDLRGDLRRQTVNYPTSEAPGTIVVDTPHTYLYFVLGGGKAIRYGIGVGREGFTWSGVKTVERKAEWP